MMDRAKQALVKMVIEPDGSDIRANSYGFDRQEGAGRHRRSLARHQQTTKWLMRLTGCLDHLNHQALHKSSTPPVHPSMHQGMAQSRTPSIKADPSAEQEHHKGA